MALMSEENHREYIEMYLEEAIVFIERGMGDMLKYFAADTINIARKAGYTRLATEYTNRFTLAGIDLE